MTNALTCPQCDGTGKYRGAYCDLCDQKGSLDRTLWQALGYPIRAVERRYPFGDYVVVNKVTIRQYPQGDLLVIQNESRVEFDNVDMFSLGVGIQETSLEETVRVDAIVDVELKQINRLLSRAGMVDYQNDLMARLAFSQEVMNVYAQSPSPDTHVPDWVDYREFTPEGEVAKSYVPESAKTLVRQGSISISMDEAIEVGGDVYRIKPDPAKCNHDFRRDADGEGYTCKTCGLPSDIPF